jgi:hypothetical protein
MHQIPTILKKMKIVLRITLRAYIVLYLCMTAFMSGSDFNMLKKAALKIIDPYTATFYVTSSAPQISNLFVHYDSLQEQPHNRVQALGIESTRDKQVKTHIIYKAVFDCRVIVRTIETKKISTSHVIVSRLSLTRLKKYSSLKRASKKLDKLVRSSRCKQEI